MAVWDLARRKAAGAATTALAADATAVVAAGGRDAAVLVERNRCRPGKTILSSIRVASR